MKILSTMMVSAALLCLLACEREGYLSPSKSSVVVEGWIEAGGFPVVMVTRTFPVLEEEVELGNLRDYILRWATVKVSCG